jgi:glycyl-tRNA synthetase alpha chain
LANRDKRLTLPAYEFCIKSSHLFNLLNARGAISVAERTGYIARVRALARQCAERYIEERAAMGHPLLNRGTRRDGTKTSRIRSKAVVHRS